MGKPDGTKQISVALTPKQEEAIEKRLREKRKTNLFASRADVIRELIELGLQADG